MLEKIYSESIAIATSDSEEKHEQYFTPSEVASLMTSMCAFSRKSSIRILDAGSGTGILGYGASIEAFESGVSSVHLVCIETETKALKLLKGNLEHLQKINPKFSYEILERDFLEISNVGEFDLIISNPPYSKISPSIVRGGDSPNLYSRFMEVSMSLLAPNGQMVYIVPRSFTNGVYFKTFRKALFAELSITNIHLFQSRKDIFVQDVLQETMIISLTKQKSRKAIVVSSCENRKDIDRRKSLRVSRKLIELGEKSDHRVAIPTTREDIQLLKLFNSWKGRFSDHGIKISTGPVVAYRSKEFLLEKPKKTGSYPMIWPGNITLQTIKWPDSKSDKQQYIDTEAKDRVVANGNYVVMKRFTTKDESKRLFTCPLKKGFLAGDFIGLGNKTNYIHMGEKSMSFTLCKGISYMLNTNLFDEYIRCINGQTQVNATDLENLPIPDIEIIKQLGKCTSKNNDYSKSLDRLLTKASEKN